MQKNKSYFAKYLPVEGEIKEALYIFWKGRVYQQYSILSNFREKTFGLFLGENQGEHIPIEEAKPAKLFLCSRDVKVGDKINYLSRNGDITFQGELDKIEGEYIFLKEDRFKEDYHMSYPLKDAYKVIGEISPQATWVKEGDEWDEDEVRVCGQQILVDKETFNSDPRSWTEAEYKVVFVGKIKGPCGHFH